MLARRSLLALVLMHTGFAAATGSIAFATSSKIYPQMLMATASYGQGNRILAENAAIQACSKNGGVGCKVVGTTANTCMALAATNEGQTFLATGSTQSSARTAAFNKCVTGNTGSCAVRASFCDWSSCTRSNDFNACVQQGLKGSGGGSAAFCRSEYC